MTCAWCRGPIPDGARRDSIYCSKRCRQAAWDFRRGCVARERAAVPMRLAYADPPYPGLARRYYADHPDYAGEVDHRALLSSLQAYDGWALSTSARALPMVLGLVAELAIEVRVAAWFRGARRVPSTHPLSAWEPVVFAGGRQVREEPSPASRVDALVHGSRPRTTDPARVIGAKPSAFAWWMFDLLGARAGDELVDLYPGSGGIGRAWSVYVSRSTSHDASSPAPLDASARAHTDGSVRPRGDASAPGGVDPSRAARSDPSPEYSPDASSSAEADPSRRTYPTGPATGPG